MTDLGGNLAGFKIAVDGWDEELQVVRFDGVEGVSRLYEFRVEVASAELPAGSLLDRTAVLVIEGIDGPRHVHGHVCRVEYLGDTDRHAIHELILVPWIWRLQQRVTHRIFRRSTTPDILRAVLDIAGVNHRHCRLGIARTYELRDHCVQYGESDLDFFNRLCEAEGITYYFEHTPTHHTLVVTDRARCPRSLDQVRLPWSPHGGHARDAECVQHFRLGEVMRPDSVALRDFNLHAPDTDLSARAGTAHEREVYEYPGRYQQAGREPHHGDEQARLRLAALQASARRGYGTSDSRRLRTGALFTLTGHRWPEFDGEYQVLHLRHRGEQPQALGESTDGEFRYDNEFECLAAELPFHAPRVTPRPVIHGVQTATVVGPASEEIHVDEHGRVRVQFHWDRRDDVDHEHSSCWVRVSQAWAGNGFGATFLPRIGHEVIVDFIAGDPDRPIITGRVHTGMNPPPFDVTADKSRSTIKSETTPGGGGSNELAFEDARDREEVYLHAQRDLRIAVEHDATTTIGQDSARTVARDDRETVGNDQETSIGAALTLHVGADRSETVGGGMTLQVGENLGETAGQNIALTAGKHLVVRTGESVNVTAGRNATIVVANRMTILCGATTIEVDASGAVKIASTSLDVQASGTVRISGGALKFN